MTAGAGTTEQLARALEEMPREHCLALLRSLCVGRAAVAAPGEAPLVFPVNYVVEGDAIVFRTSAGAKLDSMLQFPVSFQVDVIDGARRVGWSVLVRGVASEDHSRDAAPTPASWTCGHRNHRVRLTPHEITGRRIVPDEYTPTSAGYL